MTAPTENAIKQMKRLQDYCSKRFNRKTKDEIALVFSILLIFMTTCIGSMLLICFFFTMEKREMKHVPPPQTKSQRSSVLLWKCHQYSQNS